MQLRTAEPFGISRWTGQEYERVLVRVDREGITGYGEADLNRYYGESAKSVEAQLPALIESLDVSSLSPANVDEQAAGSARAAVEAAAVDWSARRAEMAAWAWLGVAPTDVPSSSATVSLAEPAEMAAKATELITQGFSALKVKLGTAQDGEILQALAPALREHPLYVDANAGWTLAQASELLPMLAPFNLKLIEQPFAPERDGQMAAFAEAVQTQWPTGTPALIADESFTRLDTLEELAEGFTGINIKLAKIGGPIQAMAALERARTRRLQVMVGCMVESSLGIAAALPVAAHADFVDLDGAWLLDHDPFVGLRNTRGQYALPTCFGWGVEPKETCFND